ncbi:hypothetical protein NDI44_22830 [Trichocoleus sp. DQ-A3]|uniref:hypothetical protein n=1 Tax=Cyanophyceae TaxID=3028117 RepID=UPI0016899268|nr:hypothetical protein [Coleofasciculus sp. FACHB-125]MBD1903365.1 hypothetical protein [Coleofasciculus sp. FACHB-125]
MKKVIQVVSIIVAILSLVFLLYGSIKLARVEAATVPQNVESGIRGVEIVQPSNIISREDAQIIMSVSMATFVIGVAGFFLSSRMEFGEPSPSIEKSQTKPQANSSLEREDESL